MGKPYADDLRLVVVRLISEGHTRPEVAELCGISRSTVGRYIRRYRATGSISPDKFGGYKDYALAKHADRIKRWIAKQPDLTLLELRARLAGAGVKVAASSVFRFLRHLGEMVRSLRTVWRASYSKLGSDFDHAASLSLTAS
jgi:transposase